MLKLMLSKPNSKKNLYVQIALSVTALFVIFFVVVSREKDSTIKWFTNDRCAEVSIEQKIQQADLIVSGDVFAVLSRDDEYANVLIDINKVYKGEVPSSGVNIIASDLSEPPDDIETISDDIIFTSDQDEYILYLHPYSDEFYKTSKCYGSRLIGNGLSDEEKSILGDGTTVENDNI